MSIYGWQLAAYGAEGYAGRLPRPDAPTIEAITKLMRAAGLSTEGERPKVVVSTKGPHSRRPSLPQRRSDLIFSEHNVRIELRGAPGRQPACDGSDHQNRDNHNRERCGVGRLDTE
jgi:hypothetical protein